MCLSSRIGRTSPSVYRFCMKNATVHQWYAHIAGEPQYRMTAEGDSSLIEFGPLIVWFNLPEAVLPHVINRFWSGRICGNEPFRLSGMRSNRSGMQCHSQQVRLVIGKERLPSMDYYYWIQHRRINRKPPIRPKPGKSYHQDAQSPQSPNS